MIRHLRADHILTGQGEPIKNGVVSVRADGQIVEVLAGRAAKKLADEAEHFHGTIVPGFINAHCHLELSHMHGAVASGEGLVAFLSAVIGKRAADEQHIVDAMRAADTEMWRNGIVAVGDISNNVLSKPVKEASAIRYHTFVELLGFDPQKADDIFHKGEALIRAFSPLPASLVPHAPYSVSKELLRLISRNETGHTELTSIHNQESDEENKLFRYKSGAFLDFYKTLNINIEYFKAQARNSIQSLLPIFPENQRILLVHNTYTSLKDIYFANRFNRNIHWCFCPKANLMIEGRLPKIDLFRTHDFNITVGTDSLASNDKLCILSELQTIKAYFPHIPLAEMIGWATINGARFLGIDSQVGTIEAGKRPGLNLITSTPDGELSEESTVQKLV